MVHAESGAHNRETLERFNEIIRERDYDALGEVLVSDFVQEIPQSGERARGIDNFRKTLEKMPGGSVGVQIATDPYISAEESHYVMTPTFNVVKLEGAADELTSYVKAKYPDGSEWYIITFTTFREGKISKRVAFFARLFDPPAWRADFVERMEPR
jgi:hypothetical protein